MTESMGDRSPERSLLEEVQRDRARAKLHADRMEHERDEARAELAEIKRRGTGAIQLDAIQRLREQKEDLMVALREEGFELAAAMRIIARRDAEIERLATTAPCGCVSRCGDDDDIDGPGVCKGLPT